MDLDDLLGPKPTVVNLRAKDRWDAIEELVGHLVAANKIKAEDSDKIIIAVKQREKSMSTGIGFGIGIPHASCEFVSDVVTAIGRSRSGIQFGALDGKPVRLVMLFLVPIGQFQKHVNTLANIARLLHNADFRDGFWRRFM